MEWVPSIPIVRPRGAAAAANCCCAGMGQVVEQVVAVPACAHATDLHEPRPDLIGRGIDGDRPCRYELRVAHELVTGHWFCELGRCRSPAKVPSAVEGCRQEERQAGRRGRLESVRAVAEVRAVVLLRRSFDRVPSADPLWVLQQGSPLRRHPVRVDELCSRGVLRHWWRRRATRMIEW